MRTVDCDFFVVGSGMAGLISALHLAKAGKVVLATKRRLADCNTNFAQGGICCVMDPADSFDAHVADTLVAGAGLCDEAVVPVDWASARRHGIFAVVLVQIGRQDSLWHLYLPDWQRVDYRP